MDTALRQLTAAVERLEAAVALAPAKTTAATDARPGSAPSHNALRAEVAATIAELDKLIGKHDG